MSQKKAELTDIKHMTFEVAYAELEETVRKLEAGSLPLAEALTFSSITWEQRITSLFCS